MAKASVPIFVLHANMPNALSTLKYFIGICQNTDDLFQAKVKHLDFLSHSLLKDETSLTPREVDCDLTISYSEFDYISARKKIISNQETINITLHDNTSRDLSVFETDQKAFQATPVEFKDIENELTLSGYMRSDINTLRENDWHISSIKRKGNQNLYTPASPPDVLLVHVAGEYSQSYLYSRGNYITDSKNVGDDQLKVIARNLADSIGCDISYTEISKNNIVNSIANEPVLECDEQYYENEICPNSIFSAALLSFQNISRSGDNLSFSF